MKFKISSSNTKQSSTFLYHATFSSFYHLIMPGARSQSNFWPMTGTARLIFFMMSVDTRSYMVSSSCEYYRSSNKHLVITISSFFDSLTLSSVALIAAMMLSALDMSFTTIASKSLFKFSCKLPIS